jgi:hypothetical protein
VHLHYYQLYLISTHLAKSDPNVIIATRACGKIAHSKTYLIHTKFTQNNISFHWHPNTTHLSSTLCSRTNKHYTPQWHTVQQDYLTLHTSVAHCAAGLPNTTHLSGTHGGLKTGELVSMSPASFKWEARAGSFAFRACRALND